MRKSLLWTTTFVFTLVLLTPATQAQIVTKVEVDLDNQRLVVIGAGFGPASQVFMGDEGGALDQLEVTNSSPNLAVATLQTTEPGNYLVLLAPSFAGGHVTIGPRATTSADNTALGLNALVSNTTGIRNAAVGLDSLTSNTTGDGNAALGDGALQENTVGIANTAVGFDALCFNASGHNNAAVGEKALFLNTTGSWNTAMGRGALLNNTTGFSNTATGLSALVDNTTGSSNTATGRNALLNNTTGSNNTAIGFGAGTKCDDRRPTTSSSITPATQ